MSRPYEAVADSEDRDTWLAARATMITASDVAAVLGTSRFTGRLALYLEKTGEAEPRSANDYMKWGLLTEGPCIDYYAMKSGRTVEPAGVLLRSTDYPWLGATLDAWTTHDDGDGTLYPCEVKASRVSADWSEGEVPDHYLAQVETQMIVTGADRATAVVTILGAPPVFIDIRSTAALRERIIDETRDFARRIEELDMPDPDRSDADRVAVGKVVGQEEKGTVATLPHESVELHRQLVEVKAVIKEAASAKQGLENGLRMMVAGCEMGVLPDGLGGYTFRTSQRKGYVVEAKEIRTLRYTKKAGL